MKTLATIILALLIGSRRALSTHGYLTDILGLSSNSHSPSSVHETGLAKSARSARGRSK